MKQIDPLQTANTKKIINTTMYEVNDTGREHEYSGDGYIKSFIGFIESLGFDITRKYEHSNNVIINDREFSIVIDNASFMSRNAFTRKCTPRKPANRWVGITKGHYGDTPFLKVFINNEMDSDKLKAKIEAAISEDQKRDKEIADSKLTNYNNTIAIGNHFFANETVKGAVNFLHIEKGVMTFVFNDGFSVKLKADNEYISTSTNFGTFDKAEDVYTFVDTISERAQKFEEAFSELILSKVLPEPLRKWTETQYHVYFYPSTMNTEPNR